MSRLGFLILIPAIGETSGCPGEMYPERAAPRRDLASCGQGPEERDEADRGDFEACRGEIGVSVSKWVSD
jgi:hypothetical protein